MKIRNFLIALLFIFLSMNLFLSCGETNSDQNSNPKKKSETEILEETKSKKQTEADSLRNEIEMLKQKRDSLNKALENEAKN